MESTLPPALPPPLPEPKPWGFWATIGLGLASFMVYSVAQTFVVMGFLAFDPGLMKDGANPAHNGLLLSVSTCLTAPVLIAVTWSFAAMRKNGPAMRDYFALRWPPRAEVARAVVCFFLFLAASDTFTVLMDRPIVPDFMVHAHRTAGFTPLLWVTVLVMAPLTEEFFFRGFLLTGLQQSKAGPVGAAVITAGVWAVIHLQYDWHGILLIFVGGLLLAWVRMRTASLPLCMALHALMNLIASLQLLGLLHHTGG